MSRSTKLAPPPTSVHPTAIVSPSASLVGTHPIIIGEESIIHLRAKLNSSHGPITIGHGCMVGERAVVGLQNNEVTESGNGVVVGDGVMIESGAKVMGNVGEGSVIEVGAVVGLGTVVGKFCKVSPLCIVAEKEVLADYTIIYGNNERRTEKKGLEALRAKMLDLHLEVLQNSEMR